MTDQVFLCIKLQLGRTEHSYTDIHIVFEGLNGTRNHERIFISVTANKLHRPHENIKRACILLPPMDLNTYEAIL